MSKTVQIPANIELTDRKLSEIVELTDENFHLKIQKVLSDTELSLLSRHVTEYFPCETLSLTLSADSLAQAEVRNLLMSLNQSWVGSVELILEKPATDEQKAQWLETFAREFVPDIQYPVYVRETLEDGTLSSQMMQGERWNHIQNTIIANIQRRNAEKTAQPQQEQRSRDESNNPLAKKIQLKEIIRRNEHLTAHNQFIPIEIQHIENIEMEVAEQVEAMEVEMQFEKRPAEEYQGRLIGAAEFVTPNMPAIVTRELFGNLPHAIKYLSPEAAQYLTEHLPLLVTLNKDNLPHGLLLKVTAQGEFVLDYDEFHEDLEENAFRPVVPQENYEPIYPITFTPEQIRAWNQPEVTQENSRSLVNLWIQRGDAGVTKFFEHLRQFPTVSEFLIQHYCLQSPQCEVYHNDQDFWASIERVSQYDETKLACFKRFIENRGSTRHNLEATVVAFDQFWTEYSRLCAEKDLPQDLMNDSKWVLPEGGNPVVYMERLLCILQNARDLKEQLSLLSELSLENYGPYYAVRYEGFKTVSKDMALEYTPHVQNAIPFNPHRNVYRVELESLASEYFDAYFDRMVMRWMKDENLENYWLVNTDLVEGKKELDFETMKASGAAIPYVADQFTPPFQLYIKREALLKRMVKVKPTKISMEEHFAYLYRVVGEQNSGITVSLFTQQAKEFINNGWMNKFDQTIFQILVSSLYFTTHERFKENISLKNLFEMLYRTTSHVEVLQYTVRLLNAMSELSIYLDQEEGAILIEPIGGMNSAEFEGIGLGKKESLEKLLTAMKKNKFSVFKFLQFRKKSSSTKWPFIYALDTEDYLSQDPLVAATYQDDLLVLAGILNSESDEAYYHGRFARDLEKSQLPVGETEELEAARVEIRKKKAQEAAETKAKITSNLEKVRGFLNKAASLGEPNNLQYAVRLVLDAMQYSTFEKFINAFEAIEKLPNFDSAKVNEILVSHGFKLGGELPEIFKKDNADLKNIMISLAIELAKVMNEPTENLYAELSKLSIAELQAGLAIVWKQAGTLLAVAGKLRLAGILKELKESELRSAFDLPTSTGLLKVIAEKLDQLPEFSDCDDFMKLNLRITEARVAGELTKKLLTNANVVAHEAEYVALFSGINFKKLDFAALHSLLTQLTRMPQRHFIDLLTILFKKPEFYENRERFTALMNQLSLLIDHYFPSDYLAAFSQFYINHPNMDDMTHFQESIANLYANDNRDPVLAFVMSQTQLPLTQILTILNITKRISENRDQLSVLLQILVKEANFPALLAELSALDADRQDKTLWLLACAHSRNRTNDPQAQKTDYADLLQHLKTLTPEQIGQLYERYRLTPVSTSCLFNALKNRDPQLSFDAFLQAFEKSPFGARPWAQQFSTADVERVVNQSTNLLDAAVYPYEYRKQLAESFLFVNAIGQSLPVYSGKPAAELTNEEIQEYFMELKEAEPENLTLFQKQLLLLGLLREAMYRSTGEFPYSTQVLHLIDCMMHEQDFISNIDTGQGKSLIDTMKAALLWMSSDRTDITTSSLVDAKRDIGNYGSFFRLLGIPFSESPITTNSTPESFKKTGVNFSTTAQLSLFYAKARYFGEELDSPDSVLSLVANESDYALLDDRVIYRFATPDSSGIQHGQEWIYGAINEFVSRKEFVNNQQASAASDIADLKDYLRSKARELKTSTKIIDKFGDEQYHIWIKSSLTACFLLRENYNFVIPDEFEKRVVNGVEYRSKVVKVLMTDDKVSPDSVFGNGVQQFLYARLNKEKGVKDFVIELEHRSIISTNNKNFFDHYLSHRGAVWGTSGTVGSQKEIGELHRKYGFEFTKMEPHQKNQTRHGKPMVCKNQAAQFKKLIQLLTPIGFRANAAPSLVFCRDIETAKAFFAELQKANKNKRPIQLYTGLGKEEDFIRDAKKPGMITVTTAALGRNTDIQYDKSVGLNVWHTCVDSIRGIGQKSGRTGRQGSPGRVHYVFNQQELGGKTLTQIQDQLDDLAATDRNMNEKLYDVLGYLLSTIDRLPTEAFKDGKTKFLRETWSDFATGAEVYYHDTQPQSNDDFAKFQALVVEHFNQALQYHLNISHQIKLEDLQAHLAHEFKRTPKAAPTTQPLKLSDCVPPVTIAYHILGTADQVADPVATKVAIQSELTAMFADLNLKNFIERNQKYLSYLRQNPATQAVIVEAHREFMSEQLKAIPNLDKITKAPHYLVMFHALTAQSQQAFVDVKPVKELITRSLDAYLKTWFIQPKRKQWAKELKASLTTIETLDDLTKALCEEQMKVASQDIAENAKRRGKGLHFFGRSRYQDSLTQAIKLTTAFHPKTPGQDSLKQAEALLTRVNKQDKANVKVIGRFLEERRMIENRSGPQGMQGRSKARRPKL